MTSCVMSQYRSRFQSKLRAKHSRSFLWRQLFFDFTFSRMSNDSLKNVILERLRLKKNKPHSMSAKAKSIWITISISTYMPFLGF